MGWEEKKKKTTIKNNHSAQNKQHVVEASASLSLSERHGNIHFDMQISSPFVQCSTEGNVDFSERQRACALIVKLKLYFLLAFSIIASVISVLSTAMERGLRRSQGLHSEEEASMNFIFM